MNQFNKNQKDVLVAFGLIVFVVCALAFFNNKKAYKNLVTEADHSLLVPDAVKLKDLIVDSTPTNLDVRQKTAPKYERKFPKRHFSSQNLSKLIFSTEDAKLENIFIQLEQTPVAKDGSLPYDNEPKWNLHIKPQTDDEFQLFLDEFIVFTLHQLEQHVEANELGHARLMAGAWWGLHFFKTMNFAGYDKDGRLLMTPPSTYANLQKNKLNSRTPANEDSTSPLFEMAQIAEDEADINYDKELESYKYRKIESAESDIFVQKNVIIFEEMIGRVARWLPIDYTPEDFHEANLDLEKEILEEVKNNPETFGYSKDKVKSFHNIADLEFSHLSEAVSRKRASMAAVIGGGLTAVFSIFEKMIQNSMAFGMYVVTTIGIEGAMVIITSIQGMKQLHMLHKYYTQMYAQKVAHELNNKGFSRRDSADARERFTDNIPNAKFAKEADVLMRRVWASSLALGFTLKYLATKHPELHTTRFHRVFHSLFISPAFTGLAALFLYLKNKGLMATLSYKFARAFLKFKMISALPVHLFLARILHVSIFEKVIHSLVDKLSGLFKGKGPKTGLSKRFSAFAGRIKVFATAILKIGTGAIGNILAGVLSGMAMHFIVYTIVSTTADEVNNIHISPGHNFQLALAHADESNEKDFKTSTREIFYPLCAIYAANSTGSLGLEVESQKTNRKAACLQLIQGFENIESESEVLSRLPEETRHLFTDSNMSTIKLNTLTNDLVEKAIAQPSSIKNTWIAALRSIYPLSHISKEFWQFKAALLFGRGKRFKYFGPSFGYGSVSGLMLSPDEVADLANQKRLIHAIEFFAEENILKTAKQSNSEPVVASKVIATSRHQKTNLVPEFLGYFKLHKEMLEETSAQFLKLEENEPDHLYSLAFDNILDSFVVTTKASWRVFTTPFNSTLDNVLQAESLEVREVTRYF